MRTTLERAARALGQPEGRSSDEIQDGGQLWRTYLPKARVVFEAIHDPSLDLVLAGGAVEDVGGVPIGAMRAEAVWISMIYRALAKVT
ncbi:hypothetical protein [Novosphingobium sp. AP12]|uniref:hypothetical protein n=1 Tax=Novosphingobium sp. AP12 TaxID=1144305 RepID=UPI000271F1DB|nr:hypothetical protein [Novosphingobium sp. AP12]EJL23097.1 hypothetical protein PMI02_04342 [Novosphingobium sp. AP12]